MGMDAAGRDWRRLTAIIANSAVPVGHNALEEKPVQKFKAYKTFQEDGTVSSRFVELSADELDPGEVLVKTKYSTINYKDALSHNGAGKIMRKFPTVAGIDMAGTVETSADARFKQGDKVIVHAYDFGVGHDGGYSEYVRVPADWVVRRSSNMTAFEAMTLGTAGFTAAQAIEAMQHNGLTPRSGPVIVNGATGGVGSVAIDVLSKLGYHVVALTGKEKEADYLKSIGAAEVVLRQSLDLAKVRPLDRSLWAGAIDNLGGDVLAWMLSTMKQGGLVASVGLAADYKLNTTVMPLILRGVYLLGINSAEVAMALRQKLWDRLANEWRPSRVQSKVVTIDFDELPTHFDAFLKGTARGRTVVRIGSDIAGL
jgi:acrylyl-CoA reductase (NADPH)